MFLEWGYAYLRRSRKVKKERSDMDRKDLRIMVIGAHPDDPEVNMAGTIAKFAESGAGRLNQSSEPHLRVLRVARRFEK
jgi:hypothetical protein